MSVLSSEQRAELGALLQAERQRLRGAIREELLQNRQQAEDGLSGQVHDAGEESVAELMSEMNTALLSRSIQELRQVEAALERIAGEGYGLCEVCAEPIPFGRLQANPVTTLCLEHQQAREGSAKP